MLVEENRRLEDEIDKYIEEAGSAELQIVNHFKLIIQLFMQRKIFRKFN